MQADFTCHLLSTYTLCQAVKHLCPPSSIIVGDSTITMGAQPNPTVHMVIQLTNTAGNDVEDNILPQIGISTRS